jgi:hypothetical protein
VLVLITSKSVSPGRGLNIEREVSVPEHNVVSVPEQNVVSVPEQNVVSVPE